MKTNYVTLRNEFTNFCRYNNIDQSVYFISQADGRVGKYAAIMKLGTSGSQSLITEFMPYSELSKWMVGYMAAKKSLTFN